MHLLHTTEYNLHDYCMQLFALIRSILKADDSIYRQITGSDTIVKKYPSSPIKNPNYVTEISQ